MTLTHEEKILDDNSVEKNGFDVFTIDNLQRLGIMPTPKKDSDYLNEISEQLIAPLNAHSYPLVCTFITKKSEKYEKVATNIVHSGAELESVIANHYAPHITVYSKDQINRLEENEYNKLIAKFGPVDHIALVVIDSHELLIPVEVGASFAEISIQAAKEIPGHAKMFNECNDALLFYKNNKEHYLAPKRSEFLHAIEDLADYTNQNIGRFPSLLSKEKSELEL